MINNVSKHLLPRHPVKPRFASGWTAAECFSPWLWIMSRVSIMTIKGGKIEDKR